MPASRTEGDLPDSCFAYVPADGPTSDRKLRLCSLETGEIDAGIVGAAAAALGPGYRGQKVQLPSDARAAAVRKVRAAWRRVNPDKDPDEMPSGIHASESGVPDDPAVATFAVRDGGERPALHVYQPLDFAEPPDWAPFLPVPGNYAHPVYGDLDFSSEAYDRIVANFKNGTYQATIPVNAEHDLSSSGAVGWITDMRRADDGAIDVRVEWNDRGRALIEGDRFKYVSAEVFDVWTDPVSGAEVPNVAVGMAICTNPYFKESVLRPLAASEAVLTRVAGAAAPKEIEMAEEPTPSTTTTAPPAEYTEPRRPDPVAKLDEAAAQEFAELRREKTRLEEENKALAAERARLLSQSRVKRFTDEVRGHSDQNGKAYVGDIPDHVRMLCDVEEQFGAGSWHVQQYQKVCRAYAELADKSEVFREYGIGRGAEAVQSAYDQIVAIARELATRTGVTEAQAFTQVLESNSELRAAHARERLGK